MKKLSYFLLLVFGLLATSCADKYIYPVGADQVNVDLSVGDDDDPPIETDPTP